MSLNLTIDSIAYRGAGIARSEGCVYFVPGTCPGEKIVAEVVREKKTFREAKVLLIENPSPDRLAKPDCRLMTSAGEIVVPGCVYDHVTPGAELRYKQEQLISFLTRQAKIENAGELVLAPFTSPKSLHYRNKITLHAGKNASGKPILGYVGEDNETVIDVPQCPLAVPEINRELTTIRADRDFWNYLGADGSVVLRWTETDGVVVIPEGPGHEEYPIPPLTEKSPVVGALSVPARGFFQVNPEVGSALVLYVTNLVEQCAPRELIDFYCGVGVFGVSASKRKIHHVVGFDSGRGVIRTANDNARRYGLPAKFFCEYSSRIAKRALSQLGPSQTLAIVDPPRAGLEPEVTTALLEHPVDDVLYVSCSPDTLARDLALLMQGGKYTVKSVRIFDMFPRTAHFETAVHLHATR